MSPTASHSPSKAPVMPPMMPFTRLIPRSIQSMDLNHSTAVWPMDFTSSGIAVTNDFTPSTTKLMTSRPRVFQSMFSSQSFAWAPIFFNASGRDFARLFTPSVMNFMMFFPSDSQLKAVNTDTTASMICGMFDTSVGMACTSPIASLAISSIPAASSLGALSFMMPAMFVTMAGTVSMKTGILSIRDCASDMTRFRPASTSSPAFSLSDPESSTSASMATGISSGRLSEIPSARRFRMPTPAPVISGRASMMPSSSVETIVFADDRMDGALSTKACPNRAAASFPVSIICGSCEAIPDRKSAKSTTAVPHISPAQDSTPETREATRPAPVSPSPAAFRSPSQKENTSCTAVSTSTGADAAMRWTTWASTSPTAPTSPSSPPSLKASWSSCTMAWASFATSLSGS